VALLQGLAAVPHRWELEIEQACPALQMDEGLELSLAAELVTSYTPYAADEADDAKIVQLSPIPASLAAELDAFEHFRTSQLNCLDRIINGATYAATTVEGDVPELDQLANLLPSVAALDRLGRRADHAAERDQGVPGGAAVEEASRAARRARHRPSRRLAAPSPSRRGRHADQGGRQVGRGR